MPTAEALAQHRQRPAEIGGRRQMLIGGRWVDALSGQTIDVEDPATGEIIGQVPAGDAADIDLAVRAARAAFEDPWAQLPPMQRTRLLLKLADALEAKAEEIGLIETYDVGQPLWLSGGSAKGAPDVIRYFAGWASKLTGDTMTPLAPGNWHAYTIREPVGVVGLIVPWNSPYSIAVTKLASALAAGCTVVVKPAEQTPLSTLRLGEIIQEVGFPDGVVNIVTGLGPDAGAALVEHPDVNKISFTGSTRTGQAIVRAAAGTMKRVTLELGGKSPVIVLPDADVDRAIEATAKGIFLNTGQICLAGSRLYAHESILDRMVDGIVSHAKKLRVGPGTEAGVEMGPVVSRAQFDRVTGYIEQGRKDGVEVATGGGRLGDTGYFVEPTILTGATRDMSVVQDEIFGPVLCAMAIDDAALEEIARKANDTTYGLGANIWTRDIGAAHKLAKLIKAGNIKINTAQFPETSMPFGGYKQSGIGRERGREGVEIYTEVKSIVVGL
ncbi:MAG TPA: aldehyde dehydrogenase family protein [Allosphingosinicella sp.]|nr:aldehyde dehydrogenase family protein [Allosphingosinicella sp.]